MTPKEFWDTYAGGFTPLTFMRLFHCQDPAACATAYASERPALFGIVRRGTWRETFSAKVQHTRPEVCAGLAAYLDETESDWRAALDELLAADAAAAALTASLPETFDIPEAAERPEGAAPTEDQIPEAMSEVVPETSD